LSEFGKRLKLLREQRDIPLSKVATSLKTTKATLSRYENGLMDPSLEAVIKIADYFNVSLDWIAGRGDILDVGKYKANGYAKVLDKFIKEDIPPDRLIKIIDIMKG